MCRKSAAALRACCTSCRLSGAEPVVHIPISFVTLCSAVRLAAARSLSGTFFWVTTQTASLPRTARLVRAPALTALKAYSTW